MHILHNVTWAEAKISITLSDNKLHIHVFGKAIGGLCDFAFCHKILSQVRQNVTIPGGIRTHDLWIRSPARYPLRYGDLHNLNTYQSK